MRPFGVAALTIALATGCQSATAKPSPGAALFTPTDVPAIAELVQESRGQLFEADGSGLALGRACGIAPAPPLAFQAVNFLVAARRTDILADVALNAPTLEGQLWGLIGLVRAGQLDPDALEQKIATVDGPVWFCDGCIAEQTDAPTAVAELLPSLPPLR